MHGADSSANLLNTFNHFLHSLSTTNVIEPSTTQLIGTRGNLKCFLIRCASNQFVISLVLFFKKFYGLLSQENPNCLLIVTPKGGHLGWIAGGEAPLGAPWTDTIVMDFLEYLRSGAYKSPASHSGTEGEQHSTEAMHHLKL